MSNSTRKLSFVCWLVLLLPLVGVLRAEESPIRVLTPSQQVEEGIYIASRWSEPAQWPEKIPEGLPTWSLPRHPGQSVQIGGEPLRDKADLSARFALAWDDAGLWIFVDVCDDRIVAGKDAEMWQGDSVQIAIDPGWEKTELFDANDLEIGLGLDDWDGQSWSWRDHRALSPAECTFRVRRTSEGYFAVAHLDWGVLHGLDRSQRSVLGLNLLVNDNDGSGRKGWICFAPGIGESKSMKKAMTVILRDGKSLILPVVPPTFMDGFAGKVFFYGFNTAAGSMLTVQASDQAGAKIDLLGPVRVTLPKGSLGVCDLQVPATSLRGGDVRLLCLVDNQPAADVVVRRLNLREQVANNEALAKQFQAEIDELASQGNPVAYLRGLWAVLDSQTRFAKQNLEDPNYPKSDSYRSKAMRRLRELEWVATLLREQIADVRSGRCPQRYRTWRYVTSPVDMKNGFLEAQTVDDAGKTTTRPVLFNGFMTLVEVGTRVPFDELKYLYQTFDTMGVNFIQYAGFGPYAWSYDKKHKVLDRSNNQWIYDPAVVASERVTENLSLAQKNNIAVDFHLQVENIYNHERDAYGLRPHDTGFLHYQINDPLAREGLGVYVRSVVTDLKNSPQASAILSFTLGNESIYIDTDLTDPLQQKAFVEYLKKRYGDDLAALNRAHKANYASFEAVVEALPKENIGYASPFPTPVTRLEYDWRLFKGELFADWFGSLRSVAHEAWPGSRVANKFMFFKSFLGGERYNNTLPVQLTAIQDINSCDNYFFQLGGCIYFTPGYQADWLATAMNYDLLTSLKKAVVSNTENHIIRDGEQGDVSYDHVYTALFQQFMHGMGCSAAWAWTDQRGDEGYPGLYGLFPERPIAAAAVSQVSFDVNRLVHEIRAFFDAEPDVAMLYSTTSYLYDPQFGDTSLRLYKQLSFLGRKVGFLSEEQMQAKAFGKVKLLLAPDVSHIQPATLAGLEAFVKQGGRIICLGDCFSKDDFDNPLSCDVPRTKWKREMSEAALAGQLRKNIRNDLGPLAVEVLHEGAVPDGVVWRVIPYGDGYLLNVVNYNTKPTEIEFRTESPGMKLFDLIRWQDVPAKMVLPPETPMLIRVGT